MACNTPSQSSRVEFQSRCRLCRFGEIQFLGIERYGPLSVALYSVSIAVLVESLPKLHIGSAHFCQSPSQCAGSSFDGVRNRFSRSFLTTSAVSDEVLLDGPDALALPFNCCDIADRLYDLQSNVC